MKKITSIIFLLFNCLFSVSAGGFSESKKINPGSITNIEIELMFESLTVSTWQGNQIVVVLESNKKDIFPLMNSENKKLLLDISEVINKDSEKNRNGN